MVSLIDEVDPSLSYRRTLKKSKVFVYEVGKGDSLYVLKATFPFKWESDHLIQEKERLILAKDVSGITHLVRDYGDVGNYKNVMLKEYFEGRQINELYPYLSDPALQKKVETTVNELHELGIAGLDLKPKNFVISPDGKDICMIDLALLASLELREEDIEFLKGLDIENMKRYIFS